MPKVGLSRSPLLPRRRCELEAMDRAGTQVRKDQGYSLFQIANAEAHLCPLSCPPSPLAFDPPGLWRGLGLIS